MLPTTPLFPSCSSFLQFLPLSSCGSAPWTNPLVAAGFIHLQFAQPCPPLVYSMMCHCSQRWCLLYSCLCFLLVIVGNFSDKVVLSAIFLGCHCLHFLSPRQSEAHRSRRWQKLLPAVRQRAVVDIIIIVFNIIIIISISVIDDKHSYVHHHNHSAGNVASCNSLSLSAL